MKVTLQHVETHAHQSLIIQIKSLNLTIVEIELGTSSLIRRDITNRLVKLEAPSQKTNFLDNVSQILIYSRVFP